MTYSLDFRKRIIKIQKDEGLSFKETANRFKIGIASLTRWHKKVEPINVRARQPRKINMEALRSDVKSHPDAYLYERAQRFGVSINCIHMALRRLGVTYKKNAHAPQGRRREARCL